MNCSMPGLPVHHQLPEFTQTHVHWVGDACYLCSWVHNVFLKFLWLISRFCLYCWFQQFDYNVPWCLSYLGFIELLWSVYLQFIKFEKILPVISSDVFAVSTSLLLELQFHMCQIMWYCPIGHWDSIFSSMFFSLCFILNSFLSYVFKYINLLFCSV